MVKEKKMLSLFGPCTDASAMRPALAHRNDQIWSFELTVSVNVAGCSFVTKTLS